MSSFSYFIPRVNLERIFKKPRRILDYPFLNCSFQMILVPLIPFFICVDLIHHHRLRGKIRCHFEIQRISSVDVFRADPVPDAVPLQHLTDLPERFLIPAFVNFVYKHQLVYHHTVTLSETFIVPPPLTFHTAFISK